MYLLVYLNNACFLSLINTLRSRQISIRQSKLVFFIFSHLPHFLILLIINPPATHIRQLTKTYIGNKYICPIISAYGSIFISLNETIKPILTMYAPIDMPKTKKQADTVPILNDKNKPIIHVIAYDTIMSMTTTLFSP